MTFGLTSATRGAGVDTFGQKMEQFAAGLLGKRHGSPGSPSGQGDQQEQNNNNNNNGGHDANWNGVYEQTPGCTPSADGVALDGSQFWADNCDLGAGGP